MAWSASSAACCALKEALDYYPPGVRLDVRIEEMHVPQPGAHQDTDAGDELTRVRYFVRDEIALSHVGAALGHTLLALA